MASRNGASASALTLSSDEVNYLVYRYMQESGFHHASFTFAHESQVHRTSIDPNLVPAGALVAFIQKGMQYMEMEANIEVRCGSSGLCSCGGGAIDACVVVRSCALVLRQQQQAVL